MENTEVIIEKLKKEHSLKGATAKALLDSIKDSLDLLLSAKVSIKTESERNRSGFRANEKVPYGFIEDRFGDLKVHPGNTIIKDAQTNIRACLKELGVTAEKGSTEKKKSNPKGKEVSLADMMAVK